MSRCGRKESVAGCSGHGWRTAEKLLSPNYLCGKTSIVSPDYLTRLLVKARISQDEVERLVDATDGYTGAQIEELVNTLYILAVDRQHAVSGNGDGESGTVVLSSDIVAAALEEFQVELKARVGFHAG